MNILEPFPMKNKKPTTRNTQNQVPSNEVMSEPCRHNLLCSCRSNASETIDNVLSKEAMSEPCTVAEAIIDNAHYRIEECIQNYMTFEETVKHLYDDHKIDQRVTKLSNLGAHPIAPASTNQCSDHYPAFSTVAAKAPSVAQAPTVICGLPTFNFGDNIENGGPYFNLIDPSLAQKLTQPEFPLQDPYGKHQPLYQQQNVWLEELLQCGVTNNELQYGGNDDELQAVLPQQQQQHHQEQETIQAKAEQQNRIPESKASNSGDNTVTRVQNQHDP